MFSEEKVAERRERQACSYADGGGSRDHSGDPIVLPDLLLPTGVLKKTASGSFRRMEIECSSMRRGRREGQAGTRNRRIREINVHEKQAPTRNRSFETFYLQSDALVESLIYQVYTPPQMCPGISENELQCEDLDHRN